MLPLFMSPLPPCTTSGGGGVSIAVCGIGKGRREEGKKGRRREEGEEEGKKGRREEGKKGTVQGGTGCTTGAVTSYPWRGGVRGDTGPTVLRSD